MQTLRTKKKPRNKDIGGLLDGDLAQLKQSPGVTHTLRSKRQTGSESNFASSEEAPIYREELMSDGLISYQGNQQWG